MLLPLSFAVIFGVRYGLGTSLTLAFAVAAPLVLLFAVAPLLAARSRRRFERVLATALAAGDTELLEIAWRRARAFRWFGWPTEVLETKGLVATTLGDVEGARGAYQLAREAHGGVGSLGVELGLGDACYQLGDDPAAIEALRRVVTEDPTHHRARRQLAHALLRSGADEGEALELLETCPEADGKGAHLDRMLRAAAYASVGDKESAKRWRKRAGKAKTPEAEALAALSKPR
ncbi:MAG: tetratricopeptide repeat protein [Myxococcota bacterium]